MQRINLLNIDIKYEQDIVIMRQKAQQIAAQLGFDMREQAAIATAVSEIARNAFTYAGGGSGEFYITGDNEQRESFFIKISDKGAGIKDVDNILNGLYHSTTGMGMGIVGSRRLMENFSINSMPGKGTTVIIGKPLPLKSLPLTNDLIIKITGELLTKLPSSVYEELRQQNQVLIATFAELKQKQEELTLLNNELEDTNRGVVALYAELDEKAESLKKMNEIKARFYSNMSHEFKTPLNSILALSRLLLNKVDGNINPEQEKQVNYIRKSAEDLLDLVNDLLDLSKVEAGKLEIKPSKFYVTEMFSTLRGLLKPLLTNPAVNLIFDEDKSFPPLFTDEGKVSQILRNFISNALKFTEKGEINVQAKYDDKTGQITFSVSDTGIGIAEKDINYIFEEFSQIDSDMQKHVKGTGLGLPLSKRLANLLNGEVNVVSRIGEGSVFSVTIPINISTGLEDAEDPTVTHDNLPVPRVMKQVLVISSDSILNKLYSKMLKGTGYNPYFVENVDEANDILNHLVPYAIIINVAFPKQNASFLLRNTRAKLNNKNIPILLSTVSSIVPEQVYKDEGLWVRNAGKEWLIKMLNTVEAPELTNKILMIDDQEISRYLIKELLTSLNYTFIEALDGKEGIRIARQNKPSLIILDLNMPGLNGYEVVLELKNNPETSAIPIIINTSKDLTTEERNNLDGISAIISKRILAETKASDIIKDIFTRSIALFKKEVTL